MKKHTIDNGTQDFCLNPLAFNKHKAAQSRGDHIRGSRFQADCCTFRGEDAFVTCRIRSWEKLPRDQPHKNEFDEITVRYDDDVADLNTKIQQFLVCAEDEDDNVLFMFPPAM